MCTRSGLAHVDFGLGPVVSQDLDLSGVPIWGCIPLLGIGVDGSLVSFQGGLEHAALQVVVTLVRQKNQRAKKVLGINYDSSKTKTNSN